MKRFGSMLALAGLLFGCGASNNTADGNAAPAGLASNFLSSVAAAFGAPQEVKTYAATRFLEQASFGPTDAAIADVKARGIEGWIENQFNVPASQIDASFSEDWNSNDTPGVLGRPYYELFRRGFAKHALASPDQLRQRMSWALERYIVVTEGKIQSFGISQWYNLLQQQAFGNYADLLRAVTKSAPMGVFLDNNQNKKAGSCDTCSINENYARELMQLFTVGVVKLNRDGTVQRDATGKPVETYSQNDVQELARALTGWNTVYVPFEKRNSYFRYPMTTEWRESHDTGQKKVLGKIIPAGGTAEQDLEAVIQILMAHPNIAPFVSLRLIQAFVTSDPSPAYLSRVATVFEDNGKGVRGDLKAVLRAILLDAEARRGDDAAVQERTVGLIREPVLHHLAMLRGLGCQMAISDAAGNMFGMYSQRPFDPPSVFGFAAPTHRAPGSLLLAPEQKMLTSDEFRNRLGGLSWILQQSPQNLADAGCRFDEFSAALATSKRAYLNLVSARYFRGSMPPQLRDMAETLSNQMEWMSTPEKAATLLQFLLSSPYFGVVK